MAEPYRSTPVFDETTLPAALRGEHRTKAGVWGVLRVIAGSVRLRFPEPGLDQVLTVDKPGLILPDQPHFVELLGPMRMQVDFYSEPPGIGYRPDGVGSG